MVAYESFNCILISRGGILVDRNAQRIKMLKETINNLGIAKALNNSKSNSDFVGTNDCI